MLCDAVFLSHPLPRSALANSIYQRQRDRFQTGCVVDAGVWGRFANGIATNQPPPLVVSSALSLSSAVILCAPLHFCAGFSSGYVHTPMATTSIHSYTLSLSISLIDVNGVMQCLTHSHLSRFFLQDSISGASASPTTSSTAGRPPLLHLFSLGRCVSLSYMIRQRRCSETEGIRRDALAFIECGKSSRPPCPPCPLSGAESGSVLRLSLSLSASRSNASFTLPMSERVTGCRSPSHGTTEGIPSARLRHQGKGRDGAVLCSGVAPVFFFRPLAYPSSLPHSLSLSFSIFVVFNCRC